MRRNHLNAVVSQLLIQRIAVIGAIADQIQGRYADAVPLYKRPLAITEKTLGPDHPDVAHLLLNLGDLYLNQGRYADAESLFQRSLAILTKVFGPDHPEVAKSLTSLGNLYWPFGRAGGKRART
jgi:tetratricopeptide (TPR) repeat protein